MTKIKVSTLTGPQLNDQVALALGWKQRLWGAIPVWFDPNDENRYRCHVAQWKPSTNPAQAYPIIEREIIGTYADSGWREDGEYGTTWEAHALSFGYMSGDTLLIAAMRAFVASKFGGEVDEA